MDLSIQTLWQRLTVKASRWRDRQRVIRLAAQVQRCSSQSRTTPPVIFFNASTRIHDISLNAAFSLLTSWAVRLRGIPVVHFVCRAGMDRCVLGAVHLACPQQRLCEDCIRLSADIFKGAYVRYFSYAPDRDLAFAIQDLTLEQLQTFEYPIPGDWIPDAANKVKIPLGTFVLSSIRWSLRRHHLKEDEKTRSLYRTYILSAWNVAEKFAALVQEIKPQAAVIFNGQFFPEAVARWICLLRGIVPVTHEVAMQPFSGFFSNGEATAYPIDIPHSFELNPLQNARLDDYLKKRLQGKFTMAGIRFWPEMNGLDETFLQKASQFKHIVPVFTNVIFDTSQPHSNVVFDSMFEWLDLVLDVMRFHPQTLFVLRAHPDEGRPGKESLESVAMWVRKNRVLELANVLFVDSRQFISSYELIQRAKFVMLYNSTIGLEASIMGKAVLCGGKARFTQYPTVFFPKTPEAYRQQAEEFLSAEQIDVPEEFHRNARRFLYYQLFRTSMSFGDFLENGKNPGFVRMRNFRLEQLVNSHDMKTIVDGIVSGQPFLIEE